MVKFENKKGGSNIIYILKFKKASNIIATMKDKDIDIDDLIKKDK
jgi:hypothetical protein